MVWLALEVGGWSVLPRLCRCLFCNSLVKHFVSLVIRDVWTFSLRIRVNWCPDSGSYSLHLAFAKPWEGHNNFPEPEKNLELDLARKSGCVLGSHMMDQGFVDQTEPFMVDRFQFRPSLRYHMIWCQHLSNYFGGIILPMVPDILRCKDNFKCKQGWMMHGPPSSWDLISWTRGL